MALEDTQYALDDTQYGSWKSKTLYRTFNHRI